MQNTVKEAALQVRADKAVEGGGGEGGGRGGKNNGSERLSVTSGELEREFSSQTQRPAWRVVVLGRVSVWLIAFRHRRTMFRSGRWRTWRRRS